MKIFLEEVYFCDGMGTTLNLTCNDMDIIIPTFGMFLVTCRFIPFLHTFIFAVTYEK